MENALVDDRSINPVVIMRVLPSVGVSVCRIGLAGQFVFRCVFASLQEGPFVGQSCHLKDASLTIWA